MRIICWHANKIFKKNWQRPKNVPFSRRLVALAFHEMFIVLKRGVITFLAADNLEYTHDSSCF